MGITAPVPEDAPAREVKGLLCLTASSITFLAYPGSAFEGNWSRLVPGLMLPIAAYISIQLFVIFYRRSGFISAYEYFEKRFGSWGRTYASFVYMLSTIFRVGIVLYLLALPVKVLTGWDQSTIIVVGMPAATNSFAVVLPWNLGLVSVHITLIFFFLAALTILKTVDE